jgi:hypothetical protein
LRRFRWAGGMTDEDVLDMWALAASKP